MKARLKVKPLYNIKSNYKCGIQRGGKYCSLKFVVQQVESRKAPLTLRSAERALTLSAGSKFNRPFSEWRGVFLFILFVVI
jgi:hypothetical protein